VPTEEVIAFARGALPPAPARVLEVGAGDGELAAALAEDGYDVLAIDPKPQAEHVRETALLDLDEPPGSFTPPSRSSRCTTSSRSSRRWSASPSW
jgi:SAM-dependent methyltransferase